MPWDLTNIIITIDTTIGMVTVVLEKTIAVDNLLDREARQRVALNLVDALQVFDGRERPTRAHRALIFDGRNGSFVYPAETLGHVFHLDGREISRGEARGVSEPRPQEETFGKIGK